MTHRLLINPGTPQAWEIQLKPGANRIGRGEHNDVQIPHGSISGTHCEIIISSAGVMLKDLGSTNGTFINRAPVKESVLQPGQHLQLGSVDMVFESTAPGASTTATTAAPAPLAAAVAPAPPVPPPIPAAARATGSGLRFSSAAHAPAAAPVAVATTEPEIEAEAPAASGPTSKVVQIAYCKFHPKTLARFFCNKCGKFFCDMCVASRASSAGTKKICRACGVDTIPVLIQRSATGGPSFYSRLPGAFVYPFKGFGVFFMIIAAIVFSALNFVGMGGFSIFIAAAAYGFLFVFMQNVIHTTTSDENVTLELPSGADLGSGFISLVGTIAMSFWLYILLWILRWQEVADIPPAALIGAKVLGCLYCPMAILAIAMKDSVVAGNPLVVFPAIFRMPLEYAVTAAVLLSAYAINEFGNQLSFGAQMDIFTTKDMGKLFVAFGIEAALSFVFIYLLTASMRVLGLLYVSKKQSFGWFAH